MFKKPLFEAYCRYWNLDLELFLVEMSAKITTEISSEGRANSKNEVKGSVWKNPCYC